MNYVQKMQDVKRSNIPSQTITKPTNKLRTNYYIPRNINIKKILSFYLIIIFYKCHFVITYSNFFCFFAIIEIYHGRHSNITSF